jgi:nicotinate-nucleotide--dimethylbenzimidazole phosphoribosyltransferase
VVDVGVASDLEPQPGLVDRKVAHGTADLSVGPAMSRAQAQQALEAGITTARDLVAAGHRLLVAGDMGIGNTTASACLVAAVACEPAERVTGRGTGIDDATWRLKTDTVQRALDLHAGAVLDRHLDPVGLVAALGGFEHAAIAGFLLGAASLRVPVVLDGVIACSAALVAQLLCSHVTDHWVAGHRSSEPGATIALERLGLEPLLDLGMRLGEGSGAVLAVSLVQAAARVLAEVATFDEAQVDEAQVDEVQVDEAAAQGATVSG